jgi:hypothetical protein
MQNYETAPRLPATKSSDPKPTSRSVDLEVEHHGLMGDFLAGDPYVATTPLPSVLWLLA